MYKIFAALDDMSIEEAFEFVHPIRKKLYGVKINHTLMRHINIFKSANMKLKVFADLKLYDIPNTVESVLKYLIKEGVYMTTIHFDNGEKCIERISPLKKDIKIAIVSHLTSFKADHSKQNSMYAHICNTSLYEKFNMILSPLDLPLFNYYDREHKFKRICPGIRLKESNDDQVRTATPKEAKNNGADYLVIGRPLKEYPIKCFL